MLQFSANLGFMWANLPLLERVKKAAAAGFKAVEFHWPYDVDAGVLHETCRRCGVRVLGLNSEPGDTRSGEFGFAALAGREAEFDSSVERALAYGTAVGATAVHVLAGVVPEGDRLYARATFVENLRRAAKAASARNLTLLLEPMNQWDKPDYFYSTVAEVASLLHEIGQQNVRLMFDVYHVARSEGDVVTKLNLMALSIGHIQVASVPTRVEPDEGEVDYREVFRAIDAIGYAGWIGCEYRPRSTPEEGLRWMEDLLPDSQ